MPPISKKTKTSPTPDKPKRLPKPLAEVEVVQKNIFKGFSFDIKVPNPDKPTAHNTYQVYAGVAELRPKGRYSDDDDVAVTFQPDTAIVLCPDTGLQERFTRDGLRAFCEGILAAMSESESA